MTPAPTCAYGLLRAGLIAAAACAAAACVRDTLASARGPLRRLLWLALVAPLATPALVIGYAYADTALALVRHPAWRDALYVVLVWARLLPVAVLLAAFAPPPVSPEAAYCWALARPRRHGLRGAVAHLRFLVYGPGRTWAVTFVLLLLLAFAETELAALLYVGAWTVALFDAQVGGLPLRESLRLARVPLACQALALALALALLERTRRTAGCATVRRARQVCSDGFSRFRARPEGLTTNPERRSGRPARGATRVRHALAVACLTGAVAGATVVPLALLLRGTLPGLTTVLRTVVLWRDIAVSVAVAAGAVAGSLVLMSLLVTPRAGRPAQHWRAFGAGALAAPGLAGGLLVALLVLALVQLPLAAALRDTPLPWLLALTLLLMPAALLMQTLFRQAEPATALHAAALLGAAHTAPTRRAAARLVFELRGRARFWTAGVLFVWAYLDLATPAVLAPPGLTAVPVRLYNLMHYGRTPALSAMVTVALAVPAALLVGLGLIWRGAVHR